MPSYEKYRRLPFDTRMVQEIQGSPSMRAEQGSQFLSSWGGSRGYQTMATMPPEQRMVYRAVEDGITESHEIAQVTGLSNSEVQSALVVLSKRGLVKIEATPAQL